MPRMSMVLVGVVGWDDVPPTCVPMCGPVIMRTRRCARASRQRLYPIISKKETTAFPPGDFWPRKMKAV